MSHNIAAPPIGPFYPRSVYADASSTSQIEDGSAAHPYKTLQAAIDAMPTITAQNALDPWGIYALGDFDEDITFPANHFIAITSDGVCRIGVLGGPSRTITMSASGSQVHGIGSILVLKNITVHASWVVSGTTGSIITLGARDCTFKTVLDGTAITDPTNASLTLTDCVCDGGINYNGALTMKGGSSGSITAHNITGLDSLTVVNGTVTSTFASGTTIKYTTITGAVNLAGSLRPAIHSTFGSTLVAGSSGGGSEMYSCRVIGTATMGDVEKLHDCNFDNILSVSGGSAGIFASNCEFLGLVTVNSGCTLDEAHGCDFQAGITLDAIPGHGIFGSLVTGNFTGPANSYKVDDATNFRSSPTLLGGATLDLLSNATEINTLTEKGVPVAGDLLLIEDSEDSNNQKKVQIGNLPGGGSGSGLTELNVTIPGGGSVGQVGKLNSNPVEVIPAPGVGKYIVIHRFHAFFDYATTPYDNAFSGDLELRYVGTTVSAASLLPGYGFFALSQDAYIFLATGEVYLKDGYNDVENRAVEVSTTGGDIYLAAGDSPIKLKLFYEIIDTTF